MTSEIMMRLFSREQIKIISLVSMTIGMRTLGLFMVLPIFSIYGSIFTNSYILIGLALGAYGITMAIFQTPLGILSDRYGRKKIMAVGIITFIAGNLISAYPVNIYGLIIGRLIEGAGAVSSAGIALVHENVSPTTRNISDAIIGISIGFSFMIGVIIGPLLSIVINYSGIFIIAAIIGGISFIPLIMIKESKKIKEFSSNSGIDKKLMIVSFISFFIYFYMIVFYLYLPYFSLKYVPVSGFYKFLIPAVIIAGIIGLLIARPADKNKTVFFSLVSLVVLLISIPVYFMNPFIKNIYYYYLAVTLFYSGYIISETVFPTLITRLARRDSYGGNLGFYTSMQHAGVFFGAVIAGLLIININRDIPVMVLLIISIIFSIFMLYYVTKFREVYLDTH
ncbi:MFS transporter [Acidiplasma sp.]|uniref:MFS transporter n=1 Tax=Acidiplasma sp. TaxID=1872114 RepID=UPI00258E4FB8|nr:MFS transporter [Acidiplasma sp.]